MAGNTDLQNLQIQRVVSKLAVGVAVEQDYISERALPPVDAGSMNFSYSTWGNEALRNVETRRGLNAQPNKVTIASGTATGELEEHTLETFYDINRLKAAEEAGNGDLFRAAHLGTVKNLIQIQKEIKAATVLFTAGNYGSNTASNVNFSSTGIRDVILAAKDARQQATGRKIGRAVAGQITHRFLLKNADIVDLLKNRNQGNKSTNATIAEYLELDEYLVGSAVYQAPAASGAVGTPTAIWTADSFALYAGDPSSAEGGFSAGGSSVTGTFAKMFSMNSPLSGARVAVRTWTPDPGLLEHALYSEYFKPALTFAEAGYLWTNTDQV